MSKVSNHRGVFAQVLLAMAAGVSALPALAQPVLEEITVTARKREESILDVPFGMSAYTKETLEQYNFKDVMELQNITPGFAMPEINVGRQDRGPLNYVIRGLNLRQVVGAADAALLFVDGAPVAGGRLASFMDVERVEVLKGPQMAYFGRNTFSGAISIVTKTPGNEWKGRFAAEAATYKSSSFDFSVEGPLVKEKLTARIALIHTDKGGHYRDNATGGRLGDRLTKAVSGTLYATPTEEMSIKLFGELSRLSDGPSASYDIPGTAGNCNPRGTGAPNWFCGEFPWTQLAEVGAGSPAVIDQLFIDRVITPFSMFDKRYIKKPGLERVQISSHAIFNYDFENADFTSIAAYHRARRQAAAELTRENRFRPCGVAAGCGRPFGQFLTLLESELTDKSVEARLTSEQAQRLRWTVGANYVAVDAIPSLSAGEQPTTTVITFGHSGTVIVRTKGIFGGIYFDVFDNLTLSAEMRYQWDKVTSTPYNLTTRLPDTAQTIFDTFENFAPRLIVEYKLDEDVRLFGNWARGFRPGTFNARLRTLPAVTVNALVALGAELSVKPDYLDQFEAGIKGSFLNGRMQGSLVGYKGKIKDQQVNNNGLVPDGLGGITNITFVGNTGRLELHGIEVEGSFAATENLTVNASFGWNSTEVQADNCAICGTLTGQPTTSSIGNRMEDEPQFTGSLAAAYTHPLTGDYDWYLRGEYFFTGNRYATRLNLAKSGRAQKVNLRTGVQTETFQVEAYGTNLTNDKTVVTMHNSGNDTGTTIPAIGFGMPDKRQWGVRAIYKF